MKIASRKFYWMENVSWYSFTIFSHELFRGSITFPTEKLPLSEKKNWTSVLVSGNK